MYSKNKYLEPGMMMWWLKLWAPGLHLAQLWPLWPLEWWNQRWRVSPLYNSAFPVDTNTSFKTKQTGSSYNSNCEVKKKEKRICDSFFCHTSNCKGYGHGACKCLVQMAKALNYRVLYYLPFQSSAMAIGMYPPWIRGEDSVYRYIKHFKKFKENRIKFILGRNISKSVWFFIVRIFMNILKTLCMCFIYINEMS